MRSAPPLRHPFMLAVHHRAQHWSSMVLFSLTLGLGVATPACKRHAKPSEPSDAQTAPPSPSAAALAPRVPRLFVQSEAGLHTAAIGADTLRYFVPEAARQAAVPVLFVLHGLGSSSQDMLELLGLTQFAAEKAFIFVAPDGTRDPLGRRFWDAGATCCNFMHLPVDDVARLGTWIAHAKRELPVDAKRVFIVGYSNGGFMAHRLACDLSSEITGIVSMAAAGPGPAEGCKPTAAVSLLEIHGAADSVVSYAGGHLFGKAELPISQPVEEAVKFWAAYNHCTAPSSAAQQLDLAAELPGAETQVTRYACPARKVELWKVNGGSHYLQLNRSALEAIWQFLLSESR